MVQNLNNNLITAPELADLRKRLRNLESRVRERISKSLKLRLISTGWSSFFHSAIQVMVLQRRCNIFIMFTCTSLRASL